MTEPAKRVWKDTELMTGRVRASFVNVFRPRMNTESGKEEFSMTLLLPKSDVETFKKMEAAAKVARENKWGLKPPQGINKPWHDGDGEKPNGGEYGEECKGCWVINVKSTTKPGLIDPKGNDIIDPTAFTSGDYCRVTLNAFAYDNKRKGVSFGLNNIQMLGKGTSLSGRRRAQDEFGEAASDEVFDETVAGGAEPW